MEVHNTVQETVTKPFQRKRNARRQSGCLRRLYKLLRYTQLNAVGRDKTFLNEQCNEIKENNTMGKTRDLFKKLEDIKGIFPSRMGTIKDRKRKDLTEEIKKRWQEYTKELYLTKKILVTWLTTMVYLT